MNYILSEDDVISSSNKAADDLFGYSIMVSGDGTRVVVGANQADSGGLVDAGAAYVFVKVGNDWVEEAILTASDKAAGDKFGSSVCMDTTGTRLVIGAPMATVSGLAQNGAAYVFSRSGTVWTQEAKIVAAIAEAGQQFGSALSFDANAVRLVVGAPLKNVGGNLDAGYAYGYKRTGNAWAIEVIYGNPGDIPGSQFGWSVAYNDAGNFVAIGTKYFPDGAVGNGLICSWTLSGSQWFYSGNPSTADKSVNKQLGASISISAAGNIVAAGAPGDSNNSGAVYIFKKNGGWTQQAKIVPTDRLVGDKFGTSVSISADGTKLIVGTNQTNPEAENNEGIVYTFTYNGTVWEQLTKTKATNRTSLASFGYSVSLSDSGDVYAVGGCQANPSNIEDAGTAYILRLIEAPEVVSMRIERLLAAPLSPEPNTMYVVKSADTGLNELYFTGHDNNALKIVDKANIETIINAAFSSFNNILLVPTITDRNALSLDRNVLVMALDASDDVTVTSGSATYVYDKDNEIYIKVSESEVMDQILDWDLIVNGVSYSAAEVDDAVSKRHVHINLIELDKISEDGDGRILYAGANVDCNIANSDW